MTADRNEAAVRPAGKSARETYVYERFDCVHTVCVLRESHRPDEDRVRTVDEQPGTCLDPLSWCAALLLDLRPRVERSETAAESTTTDGDEIWMLMQNKGQVDVLHPSREVALARARAVAEASKGRVFEHGNGRVSVQNE